MRRERQREMRRERQKQTEDRKRENVTHAER